MALLLTYSALCLDATEVALPKENTIWKGDFNRLNTSIDATEVALPTAQTNVIASLLTCYAFCFLCYSAGVGKKNPTYLLFLDLRVIL